MLYFSGFCREIWKIEIKKEKNIKKLLTGKYFGDRISLASAVRKHSRHNQQHMERYRSGHNEAVLKTVCPQGRVGSNPTLSVSQVAENNLKKLKKVLDKSWRTGYNIQGFSSERLK